MLIRVKISLAQVEGTQVSCVVIFSSQLGGSWDWKKPETSVHVKFSCSFLCLALLLIFKIAR